MEAIRMKGGHRFRLRHGPSTKVESLPPSATVAATPRGYGGLKPKVVVKEGDTVARGALLFHDKRRPEVKFTSPASGTVKEVRYGERRKLLAVVIETSGTDAVDFGAVDVAKISTLTSDVVVDRLVESGLWSRFVAYPTGDVAPRPNEEATKHLRAIYVATFATEPHLPDPNVSVQGHEELFRAGLETLKRVAPTWVVSATGGSFPVDVSKISGIERRSITPRYPAENAGVMSYYTARLATSEVAVGLTVEDVIDIGHLFVKGTVRPERTYSVAGDAAAAPRHLRGAVGVPVSAVAGAVGDDVRIIAGGLFMGNKASADDYLSPRDQGVLLMREDRARIPFAFQRLGLDKFTLLRTFVSGFLPGVERLATTSNNGEERACIQCGACIDICPVELMPNIVFKAALAKDIERMEAVALKDCVGCGLCSFVCPSKIELVQHIEDGRALIAREG